MKREILFRGKRVDNWKWAEGSLINNAFVISATKEPIPYIFSLDSDADCWEDMNEEDDFKEVIPETLGQFTGLTDKNGVKIFEGDIIEGKSYLYGHQLKNGNQFDYKGVVEFQTQCDVGLCWVVSNEKGSWNLNQTVHRNQIDFCTGTIIGNIHDNPELLTK